MNLLLFNGRLTDKDKQVILFWMSRRRDQYYGDDLFNDPTPALFYDRQKVLTKAMEYLKDYGSGAKHHSAPEFSSTFPTYEKLLKLMEEANEKDTKVRAAG